MFQSAGRIIGWLKLRFCFVLVVDCSFQSAGRIIGWLKLVAFTSMSGRRVAFQSAGRIIGWLKSNRAPRKQGGAKCFNPPGGLLVG